MISINKKRVTNTDHGKLFREITVNNFTTVWKFHNFSITQILRQINFGDSRSAKAAILAHLEALNLDFS